MPPRSSNPTILLGIDLEELTTVCGGTKAEPTAPPTPAPELPSLIKPASPANGWFVPTRR